MDETRVYLTESLASAKETSNSSNTIIGHIMTIMGIIIILFGFFLCGYYAFSSKEFNWLTALCWAAGGIATGTFFLAISQLIKLLHNINQKL